MRINKNVFHIQNLAACSLPIMLKQSIFVLNSWFENHNKTLLFIQFLLVYMCTFFYRPTNLHFAQIYLYFKCNKCFSKRKSISFHLGDEGQDGGLIPSECCSQKGYDHLQVVYQQRSIVVGREGFLPCLGSWSSHSQWCRWVQPQE